MVGAVVGVGHAKGVGALVACRARRCGGRRLRRRGHLGARWRFVVAESGAWSVTAEVAQVQAYFLFGVLGLWFLVFVMSRGRG